MQPVMASGGQGVRLGPGKDAGRHPDREIPVPLGAPAVVPTVSTLWEVLEYWAAAREDRACAYFIGVDDVVTSLGWSTLRDRALRCACGLAAVGVLPGETVAIALPTGEDLLVAFFACQRLGALPCIMDPPGRGRGFSVWCDRALPKLTLAEPRVLIADNEMLDALRDALARAATPWRVIGLSAITSMGTATGEPPKPSAPYGPAILQFTSGTTSQPKAVVCSQEAVLANLRCIGGEVRQFYEGDLMVGWLPLFHDMGLVATTLAALSHGMAVALMSPAAFVLRPARWLWAMHTLRGTISFAPNFAFRMCVRRLR
jgi:fatty-acyl-CoA synthase